MAPSTHYMHTLHVGFQSSGPALPSGTFYSESRVLND